MPWRQLSHHRAADKFDGNGGYLYKRHQANLYAYPVCTPRRYNGGGISNLFLPKHVRSSPRSAMTFLPPVAFKDGQRYELKRHKSFAQNGLMPISIRLQFATGGNRAQTAWFA